MNNITKVSVGIDVSKDHLDICIHPSEEQFRIDNTKKGMQRLLEKLSGSEVKQIVCESSGGYEHILCKVAMQAGYNVWQVDPIRIKGFIVSEGIRVKTDKHDAKMIALFAAKKQNKHPRKKISESALQLRALVRRKVDLKKMGSNEKKRLRHPAQLYCKKAIKQHIAFMEKQVEILNKQIADLLEKDDDFRHRAEIMESMPGIGKATSATLIAEMPELGELGNKQAASLLGVAPYAKQSGSYQGKTIIKGGRSIARHAFYMAALTASRSNPILADFYKKLRDAGKKPKVAIIAVMRKMITILNTMIKNDTFWLTNT